MFTIGQLARRTGAKVQTIRYYEEIGILPEPPRSEGNQRLYDEHAVDRLAFIRHARELGFSLEAVRDLLSLADSPGQSCQAADAIARRQLEAVEARMARLQSLKMELERMIEQCQGGKIANCRVIEVLSDHNQCLTENHTDAAANS